MDEEQQPKKTENETANNIITVCIERTDKTYVEGYLVFEKKTPLKKIIDDTNKFINSIKNGKNNGDGFT